MKKILCFIISILLTFSLTACKDNKEIVYYNRIFQKTFIITKREEIQSSGYIVSTLEAALWCIFTTSSYKEAVLKAVNLGDDTDTVAAITGGMAGVLYGFDNIPASWINALLRRADIENYSEVFKNIL